MSGDSTSDLELVSGDSTSDLELVSGDSTSDLELVSGDSTSDLELVSGGSTSDLEFVSGDSTSDLELVSGDSTSDLELVSGGSTSDLELVSACILRPHLSFWFSKKLNYFTGMHNKNISTDPLHAAYLITLYLTYYTSYAHHFNLSVTVYFTLRNIKNSFI